MKPSIPSFGVDRRALLSTLAVLPVLSAPLFSVSASAQTVPPAPLHSHFWRTFYGSTNCSSLLYGRLRPGHLGGARRPLQCQNRAVRTRSATIRRAERRTV